jgi:hypothetical protein
MPAYNAIINALELNPSILADLVEEFPPDRRHIRAVPNKWSALEHIAHLARVGPVMNARLKQMIEEPNKPVVPYNPDQDSPTLLADADWDESLSKYQWERAALVGVLREMNLLTWEHEVKHPEYRTYSIRIMARHLALHDLMHGSRMEDLLLATTRP